VCICCLGFRVSVCECMYGGVSVYAVWVFLCVCGACGELI